MLVLTDTLVGISIGLILGLFLAWFEFRALRGELKSMAVLADASAGHLEIT